MFRLMTILFALFAVNYADKNNYYGYQVLRILPQTPDDLKILETVQNNKNFDVWRKSSTLNEDWDIMVSPEKLNNLKQTLRSNDIPYEVFIEDVQKNINYNEAVSFAMPGFRNISFERYNRYSEIVSYLKSMASEYPNLATLFSIGKSYEGRDIYGLKISSGGFGNPGILVDCGIHAREWLAPAQGLYIINQLLENSANSGMIQNVDWYIIPLLNPDGYEYTHTSDRMWRKTRSRGSFCNGVDANRNFGFHWNEIGASDYECDETYAGPNAFSEAETRALRNFVLNHPSTFKLYLTFHSYGSMLLYPWGWTWEYPDNADELQYLGEKFKDAVRAVRGTRYTVGSSTNVLYPAAGGSDDWMLGEAGIPLSYTIELPGLGSGFQPPAYEIAGVVAETFEGVKIFHNYVKNL